MVTKYHGLSITLLLKSKTIKFTSVVHFHTVQILYKTINYLLPTYLVPHNIQNIFFTGMVDNI